MAVIDLRKYQRYERTPRGGAGIYLLVQRDAVCLSKRAFAALGSPSHVQMWHHAGERTLAFTACAADAQDALKVNSRNRRLACGRLLHAAGLRPKPQRGQSGRQLSSRRLETQVQRTADGQKVLVFCYAELLAGESGAP